MSSRNRIHFLKSGEKNDYTNYKVGDYEVLQFQELIYEIILEDDSIYDGLCCAGICDKTGKEMYFRRVTHEIEIKKSNKLNKKLYSNYIFEDGGHIVIRK